MIAVPAKPKPELRLTHDARAALVFSAAAAAIAQHQIELAGLGAVAMRRHGNNYRLTVGRLYVSLWTPQV